MLEDKIDALVAALNANTEAHGGKPAKVGTAGKPGQAVAPGRAVPEKITMEMVKAAVYGVRDAHDKAAALKIIKTAGGAAELSAVKPARYAAVIAACAEIMGEGDSDDATDAADDEL